MFHIQKGSCSANFLSLSILCCEVEDAGMGAPFPQRAVNHKVYSVSSLLLASVIGRASLLEKSGCGAS